ncbi:hypothetical protein ACFLYO_06120, partial [Chloroflexota bacterium]
QVDLLLPEKRARYRWAFGLALGITAGLTFGLTIQPVINLMFALNMGLSVGLISGLVAGVLFGLSDTLSDIVLGTFDPIRPVETQGLRWSEFRRGLMYKGTKDIGGLAAGVLLGLMLGVFFGIVFGLRMGLAFGLAFGLAAGLASALAKSFAGEVISENTRPNQGMWRTRNHLLRMVGVGLLAGLVFMGVLLVAGLLIADPVFIWLVQASWPFTILFIFIAMGYSMEIPIRHFILRVMLTRAGYMPWNYAAFLDYCCDHVLLERVGGGYRFVHVLLRDYFADLGEEAGG